MWTAEISLDKLHILHTEHDVRFVPLAVFPPVRRDITFIGKPDITAGAIQDAIAALKVPLLADARLIDYFEPQGKNEKNLTFRLTFRHAERTLKDAEADKQRDAVAVGVQKALPVRV